MTWSGHSRRTGSARDSEVRHVNGSKREALALSHALRNDRDGGHFGVLGTHTSRAERATRLDWSEEIQSVLVLEVAVQERSPRRRRRPATLEHVLRYGVGTATSMSSLAERHLQSGRTPMSEKDVEYTFPA
jgi:hypothetical protein